MAIASASLMGGKDHINYSFRTMARDQVEVMAALGYERFFVAGHDRGALLPIEWRSIIKAAFMDDRALAEYIRCFTPKTIHGSCEDYRAAAGIDLDHDEADHKSGRRIAAPTLVLWGRRSHTREAVFARFLISSGVSFGLSMFRVSFTSLPVNQNDA